MSLTTDGAGAVAIRPVETSRDVRDFWRASLAAQGGDPGFVPPLLQETHETITPLCSPFARANDGMSWVAYRSGAPVGRIYAVKDKAYLAKHQDSTGHFGFLEAIDDDAVFDALFAAASTFLKARGLSRVAGPFSGSINHECGLLVEGFGARSSTHTNYAPAYYARQLERLGFVGVQDLVGYEAKLADSRLPDRVASIRARWAHSGDLALRTAKGPAALAEVNDVYNDAWSANWGSTPVSFEEAQFLAKLAEPILPKDWTTLCDWRGEAIGILCMAPDLNEAVRDIGGRLAPFGWAKMLWRLKVSGVSRTRVPIIGVRKAWRGTRVGAMAAAVLLADAVEKARKAGCTSLEVSWMLEANRSIVNLVRSTPAKKTRVWRIYDKAL